jgi:hypothetical protein
LLAKIFVDLPVDGEVALDLIASGAPEVRRDGEDAAENPESLLFGPDFPPALISDKPVGVAEHFMVNAVIFVGIAIVAGVPEPLLEARQVVSICFGDHGIASSAA